MKTIIENSTRLSKYIFENETFIEIKDDRIITHSFIIADLNSTNASLIENIEAPEDWVGNKYFYTEEGLWELNPDYTE